MNETINVKLLHKGQGKIKCPFCEEIMRLYQHEKDYRDAKLYYVCSQCNSIVSKEVIF